MNRLLFRDVCDFFCFEVRSISDIEIYPAIPTSPARKMNFQAIGLRSWLLSILLVGASPFFIGFVESDEPIVSHKESSQPANAPLKFELDILPILTARGCNSGPCHGKARGQNGFRFLLCWDLTPIWTFTQSSKMRGRRLFPTAPDQSLFLRKAIGAVPHGGGVRIDPRGNDYQNLVE